MEIVTYARRSNRVIHKNITYNEDDRKGRSVVDFTKKELLRSVQRIIRISPVEDVLLMHN